MSALSAYILYNKEDVSKNKWFINEFINKLSSMNCTAKLITVDQLYSILNENSTTNNNIDYSKIGFKPDFVINRSRDFILSKNFENDGIIVFNNSLVSELANDKDLTYQFSIKNSINVLPYISVPFNKIEFSDYKSILSLAKDFGYPFVLKPAEGHGGFHVNLIENEKMLIDELSSLKKENSQSGLSFKKIIIQKPALTLGKDLRVYVMGKDIVCAIMRSSDVDFRANFSIGGKSSLHDLTQKEKDLINKAISIIPGDFYGIDLIYDNETPVLNELEDAVGTRMIYANTNIDIVNEYVHYILNKIKKS